MLSEAQVFLFLSVCEHGSFAQAASILGISRQAVSKSIGTIEQHFGKRLFVRDHQCVSLTAPGQLVFEYLSGCMTQYETLLAQLALLKDQQDVLRVGFHDHLSMDSALMQILHAGESGLYTRIEIEVEHRSPAILLSSLREHRLDIVMQCKKFLRGNEPFAVREIVNIPLVLLVYKFNPLVAQAKSYKDFIHEPLIINRFEGESQIEFDRRTDEMIDSLGLAPCSIIESPNRDSAFLAVKMGRGVLVGSNTSRHASAYNMRTYPLEKTDTLVCLSRENDQNPAIAAYLEWLCNNPGGIA